MTSTDSPVVHVLTEASHRGAQAYARELCSELDAVGERHLLLALYRTDDGWEPDVGLDGHRSRLASAGASPRVWGRLRHALRDLDPAVIVAYGGEAASYVAAAAPRRTPMVWRKIGVSNVTVRNRLHAWRYGLPARRFGHVAAVSAEAADDAVRTLGIDPAVVSVLANGRDPSIYHPPERRPERGAGVALVFVGAVNGPKRPQVFIEVVARLRAAGADVLGTLVGTGPLLDELRRTAPEGVELLGRRDDVPDILRASDVLVFVGEPFEGTPGVLIEAGLTGLPVVTTDVPGARSVVADGETGYVVGVDDREAIHAAVARLVDDAELRAALGRQARERCEERFSIAGVAAEWRELLGRLRSG